MKPYYLIIALPFFFACEKESKRNALLKDSLTVVKEEVVSTQYQDDSIISNRDAAITEFIYSYNEISDNLKTIKAKENILSTTLKSENYKESQKDQIIKDIQIIYDQMNDNKRKLAKVSKRLKKSNLKIDDLEKAITNLNNQIADKDLDIAALRNGLEKLNIDFSNLSMAYVDEVIASAEKTDLLNVAYYTLGTSKELKKKKIVTAKGGFIGIGRTQEINNELAKTDFIKIDISVISEIPLDAAKKVKLITPHASSSYQLTKVSDNYDKLIITDAAKFWESSKYLVIELTN